MKAKIEELETKQVTTKFGEKTVWKAKVDGKWYSAWQASWNQHWAAGEEIEADVERRGSYFNLVEPKPGNISEEFQSSVKGYFGAILSEIQNLRKEVAAITKKPPPIKKEAIPKAVATTDKPLEDLPF